MKFLTFLIYIFILLLPCCTREDLGGRVEFEDGAYEDVVLNMESLPMVTVGENVKEDDFSEPAHSRTAVGVDENRISNIWVFQYTSDGKSLMGAPKYYTVTGDKSVSVQLRAGNSRLFFIANTNNPKLVGGDFRHGTLDELKSRTVSLPTEEKVYGEGNKNLLKSAELSTDIVAGKPNSINISFKHMLAKLVFRFTRAEAAKDLTVSSMTINNVPSIARIGEYSGNYPSGSFETSTYNPIVPSEGTDYVFYLPENRQGTVSGVSGEADKNNHAPDKALSIRLSVESAADGGQYAYTVYPGENVTTDFNIKRGRQYNVTVNLKSTSTDERVLADPANCFVMKPGASIVFDPYDRPEDGGGFKYTAYVNKSVRAKKIERVDILWQTKYNGTLAIGNNSTGKLVYKDEKDRVHVKAGGNGNALIAGYNSSGEIVWSWHIWVNENEPAKLENAVLYNTYQWDENNIYGRDSGRPRVKGYPFMSCNLGAMDSKQNSKSSMGLLYQWGRKDPFLQAGAGDWNNKFLNYSNVPSSEQYGRIIEVFDKEGNFIEISSTKDGNGKGLFNAVKTSAENGTVEYAIKHPTTFIAASKEIGMFGLPASEKVSGDVGNYINNGGWYWVPDGNYALSDRLWGGSPFGEDGQKILTINKKEILADNGAKPGNKSIFDPCPAGWMLPASDAWLGFTSDGLNKKGDTSFMNIDPENSSSDIHSFTIYMQDWRNGPTSFFPIQGFRLADGSIARASGCGAYFTSAASPGGDSYILHIHSGFLYPYDFTIYAYNRRAVAASIRCVRMTK